MKPIPAIDLESAEPITTALTINVENDNVDKAKSNVDKGSRGIADNTLEIEPPDQRS